MGTNPGLRDNGSYHPGATQVPDESGTTKEEVEVQDPMVCDPICPFIIPVMLKHPQIGKVVHQGALINTGCTRYLLQ